MPPIGSICVAYDATCGICTSVKDWMGRQTPLVTLEFVATGSAEARRRFPALPAGELAVIADTGEVWLGNHAWIVCLWALRDYRGWAERLSRPGLSLLAREAFALISSNRARLSGIFRLPSDVALEQQLRKVMVPKCEAERKPPGV
jgi:predicted DCC family thiol-disulfide oxidoreductase YuxK